MKRIVFAMAKGGTGKTTSAINLAHGLARAGRKVLLMDLDTQNQIARHFALPEERQQRSFMDYVQKRVSIMPLCTEIKPNLWLLPSCGHHLIRLKRHIDKIKDEKAKAGFLASKLNFGETCLLDYLVIDCAPGWDILTLNAIMAADLVIAPTECEFYGVENVEQVFMSYLKGALKMRHPDVFQFRILPTFFDRRVTHAAECLEILQERYKSNVLRPIRYNAKIVRTAKEHCTIFDLFTATRKAISAVDYARLTREIQGLFEPKRQK